MTLPGNIIKNPLTIIAIFAGIVEIGSNTVLPFLTDENQATYVWFLMIFPVLLVSVFFFILYTKHEVLYAPSDFNSDKTFENILTTQRKATTKEVNKKLDEEIQALDTKDSEKVESKKKDKESDEQTRLNKFRNIFQRTSSRIKYYRKVESSLLDLYKLNYNKKLQKNMIFEDNSNNRLTVDGAIINSKKQKIHFIEVKFFTRQMMLYSMIRMFLDRNQNILANISKSDKIRITFIALCLDNDILETYERIESRINNRFPNCKVKVIPYAITSFDKDKIEFINSQKEKNTIHFT